MKKTFSYLFCATLITFCLQFAGCKKHDTPPPVEVCQITHAKFTFGFIDDSGDLTYNSLGNPVSFILNSIGTGNPNVTFLYDKYNRVTDYIGTYNKIDPAHLPDTISFEFWTRFTYPDQNANSLPVADTARSFGFRANGQFTTFSLTFIGSYTFDSQGRITSYKSTGNSTPTVYTYDAKGNSYPANAMPDDKVNFHRTSKVFQLVDKDYNANNLYPATTYNSNALPTVYPLSTYPNANAYFLHRLLNFSTIDYACGISSAAE